MKFMIKDTLSDIRRMFMDWKLDCNHSDDLRAVKRTMKFLLSRGKVGLKQLFGTGIGFILICVLLFEVVPHPSFQRVEPESAQQEQPVEETNSAITTKVRTKQPKEKKPVDWDMVIGFIFLVVVVNCTVALTFWRKDRKKFTPEMIKQRLKDEDAKHREKRRNIMFDLFRSQGLDLRTVPNKNSLADDMADEVETKEE